MKRMRGRYKEKAKQAKREVAKRREAGTRKLE